MNRNDEKCCADFSCAFALKILRCDRNVETTGTLNDKVICSEQDDDDDDDGVPLPTLFLFQKN